MCRLGRAVRCTGDRIGHHRGASPGVREADGGVTGRSLGGRRGWCVNFQQPFDDGGELVFGLRVIGAFAQAAEALFERLTLGGVEGGEDVIRSFGEMEGAAHAVVAVCEEVVMETRAVEDDVREVGVGRGAGDERLAAQGEVFDADFHESVCRPAGVRRRRGGRR
jgi:hypothetical protein